MYEHGISATKLTVDLSAMMKRKTSVVDTLTGGINMLLKRNKVTTYVGRGKLIGNGQVEVSTNDTLTAENIIVATGSQPMHLKGVEYDGDFIGDSTTELVAGWRAGCCTAGVRTGNSLKDAAFHVDPDMTTESAAGAIKWIARDQTVLRRSA